MVKLAVIIIGHFRSFEKTYKSLLSELQDENIDYDLFLHTWSTQNAITKSWHNILESPKDLSPEQISLLQSLDPNVEIETQVFSPEELSDIINKKPCKAVVYLFKALQKCLKRVELKNNSQDHKYDYILVTRYDVFHKNLGLSKLKIRSNEICIGHRTKYSEGYIDSLLANDIIFSFRSEDISKFYIDFENYINDKKRQIKIVEEIYTLFFKENFRIVSREWEYDLEFFIVR